MIELVKNLEKLNKTHLRIDINSSASDMARRLPDARKGSWVASARGAVVHTYQAIILF